MTRPVEADRHRSPSTHQYSVATGTSLSKGKDGAGEVMRLGLVVLALGQHLRISHVGGIALEVVDDVLDSPS